MHRNVRALSRGLALIREDTLKDMRKDELLGEIRELVSSCVAPV